MSWKIGNGKTILFWYDVWLIKEPLLVHAIQQISEEQRHFSVRDYWKDEGAWNWELLRDLFPGKLIYELGKRIIRMEVADFDVLRWRKTTSRNFFVRLVRQLLLGLGLLSTHTLWSRI